MGEFSPLEPAGQIPLEQLAEPQAMYVQSERVGRFRSIAIQAGAVLAVSATALLGGKAASAPAPLEYAGIGAVSTPNGHGDNLGISNDGETDLWTGFGVTGTPESLQYVTADFTVPSVTCPETGTYAVGIWAGEGSGTNSNPMLQTGISIKCTNGNLAVVPFYQEFYPDGELVSQAFLYPHTPAAGDQIVAEVVPSESPSFYVEDFGTDPSNTSPNWTDSESPGSLGFSPALSESECIVEDPDDGSLDRIPLVDFGTIDFVTGEAYPDGGCDVTANDAEVVISSSDESLNPWITSETLTEWGGGDIVSGSDDLASNSGRSSDGSFSVSWIASS
jgi:hypothetical protein